MKRGVHTSRSLCALLNRGTSRTAKQLHVAGCVRQPVRLLDYLAACKCAAKRISVATSTSLSSPKPCGYYGPHRAHGNPRPVADLQVDIPRRTYRSPLGARIAFLISTVRHLRTCGQCAPRTFPPLFAHCLPWCSTLWNRLSSRDLALGVCGRNNSCNQPLTRHPTDFLEPLDIHGFWTTTRGVERKVVGPEIGLEAFCCCE